MISLKQLFSKAYPNNRDLSSLPDLPLEGLECDSRKVSPGFLFIAVRGVKSDGADYIEEALRRGAVAVAGEGLGGFSLPDSVPFVSIPEGRSAPARLAAAFYGEPSKALQVVGITGTNGKTTTSYLLEHLLMRENRKPGVIGTVNYRFAGKELPAVETTPGALRLQAMLAEMRSAGCDSAVMEVSSHALDQQRAAGIDFEAALFTNLTQDHLDYHKTMEAYFEAKAKLFTGLAPSKTAALNADDAWTVRLKSRLNCRVVTYGIKDADLAARDIRFEINHTHFNLQWEGGSAAVESPLVGLHNVYNVLGALAVARALGLDLRRACESISTFPGVPGRLESVDCGQDFKVFIDFAHTPDGLENVLSALTPYCRGGPLGRPGEQGKQGGPAGRPYNGKLIVVFGCGGDRDREKRPKMAKIASRLSDFIYVTSDNPRSEDPKAIAQEVCAGFPEGFKNFAMVIDRKKAIRQAFLAARAGDIVLLAGKGHERTQVIGKEAFPFNEREEAERVLLGR